MGNYYEVVNRGNLRYRSLRRITEPAVEPVSIAEAKAHLRIDQDFTDDDLYVQSLISAARIHVENASSRTLILSQWQMKLDVFPGWDIELPKPPIAPGDVTVSYIPSDSAYLPVLFANFRVDRDSTPAVIRPQWNGSWPSARGAENDVSITYWAGYGQSPQDVPAPLAIAFSCSRQGGTQTARRSCRGLSIQSRWRSNCCWGQSIGGSIDSHANPSRRPARGCYGPSCD